MLLILGLLDRDDIFGRDYTDANLIQSHILNRVRIGCSKLCAAMFCPSCNAKFPHGTVFCACCHVTLISDLSDADEVLEGAYPGSALVHLWRGEDAALHASLLEALAEAGISFYEQPLGTGPSARPIDRLLEHAHPRFGFEVAVLSSDLAQAEMILEKLLNEGSVDMALAAKEAGEPTKEKARTAAPGMATCEVWSGGDEGLAGFLEAALRENQIPVRVESHGQRVAVYAPPEDEVRAKEIIQEIMEGVPPE
jgi:hypothetical protein